MENIDIRGLQETDADEIARIYEEITQKPVTADFKGLIESHARHKSDVCLVAQREGKVVGFMISYILTLGFGMEKSAWIATLGVDPHFMGQGIGDRMAQEIFKAYKERGINHIYSSVRWDSADILSFFKTLGFDRSDFINLKKTISS